MSAENELATVFSDFIPKPVGYKFHIQTARDRAGLNILYEQAHTSGNNTCNLSCWKHDLFIHKRNNLKIHKRVTCTPYL